MSLLGSLGQSCLLAEAAGDLEETITATRLHLSARRIWLAIHRPFGPLHGNEQMRTAPRSVITVSTIAAAVATAVVCAVIYRRQLPIPIDAHLVRASAKPMKRLDPSPISNFLRVVFVMDVSESIHALATKNAAYGWLRVAPNGPHYHLSDAGLSIISEGRFEVELELDLGRSNPPTPEELRGLLAEPRRIDVQLGIHDGTRIIAESGWMTANSLLTSIESQLR